MGFKDLFKKRGEPAATPEPAEIAGLLARLASPDWKVRFDACKALKAFGPEAVRAVPMLHELITDDNGDVCNAAADALSSIER